MFMIVIVTVRKVHAYCLTAKWASIGSGSDWSWFNVDWLPF